MHIIGTYFVLRCYGRSRVESRVNDASMLLRRRGRAHGGLYALARNCRSFSYLENRSKSSYRVR